MIAKGNLHGNGGGLAGYLLTGERDEIAQLVEARGLEGFGDDPVEAFATLQKVAEAHTQSWKPFFHVQTRNPDGDKQLTDEQWLQIADREEKRLGLTGQPRIVSFHIEDGEKHMHVAWFRIDLETMRAIDSGLYKNHLKQLCRSLEKEYGLQEVSNSRQPEDRARTADRKEVEEARRLGMDVREVRNAILDCLQHTDNGKAFNAALEERGLMLATGDRRDCFVVIDQAGGHHALNKKLTGLTLGELRDRLGDLDRAQLPTVDQAKAMQQEKHPTPDLAREAWDLSLERLRNMAGRYDPLRQESEQQQHDERPEAKQPAPAPEKATKEQERPAAPEPEKSAKEPERPAAKEQAAQGERWQERPATKMEEKIFQMQDAAERGGQPLGAALWKEGITLARADAAGIAAKDAEYRREFESEKLQGNADARLRVSKVQEGELVAVTKSGDVFRLNPRFLDLDKLEHAASPNLTPSLSATLDYMEQTRTQERAEFWQRRDETGMEKRINELHDMAAFRDGKGFREMLHEDGILLARVDQAGIAMKDADYQRDYQNEILAGNADARLRVSKVQEGELVAVTSSGDVFRLNPRFVDTDALEKSFQAGQFATPSLSESLEHFADARQQQREDRQAQQHAIYETREEIHQQGIFARDIRAGADDAVRGITGDAVFEVVNVNGIATSLGSFVESLFGMRTPRPPMTPEQQQQCAFEALERIEESIQRGDRLTASDVANLLPEQLMNLRLHGDDYMREMIDDLARYREQEQDYGREREREL